MCFSVLQMPNFSSLQSKLFLFKTIYKLHMVKLKKISTSLGVITLFIIFHFRCFCSIYNCRKFSQNVEADLKKFIYLLINLHFLCLNSFEFELLVIIINKMRSICNVCFNFIGLVIRLLVYAINIFLIIYGYLCCDAGGESQ